MTILPVGQKGNACKFEVKENRVEVQKRLILVKRSQELFAWIIKKDSL